MKYINLPRAGQSHLGISKRRGLMAIRQKSSELRFETDVRLSEIDLGPNLKRELGLYCCRSSPYVVFCDRFKEKSANYISTLICRRPQATANAAAYRFSHCDAKEKCLNKNARLRTFIRTDVDHEEFNAQPQSPNPKSESEMTITAYASV